MATITEIAPDLHRICVFAPQFNLQFNHFLIRDEQPLLFHTGMRRMFPEVREAVARVLGPAALRWIGFSHFEVDECGALNQWLAEAPQAQAVHGPVGAMVNLTDFADRPPRILGAQDVLSTGKYRFRFHATPHLPHGWDAGVLFEETQRTLLCSDLFHQIGDVEPIFRGDVVGRTGQAMKEYQAGPLMDYMPYHSKTRGLLDGLAALQPRTLAIMHGSSFAGDAAQALRDLDGVMKEVLGRPAA